MGGEQEFDPDTLINYEMCPSSPKPATSSSTPSSSSGTSLQVAEDLSQNQTNQSIASSSSSSLDTSQSSTPQALLTKFNEYYLGHECHKGILRNCFGPNVDPSSGNQLLPIYAAQRHLWDLSVVCTYLCLEIQLFPFHWTESTGTTEYLPNTKARKTRVLKGEVIPWYSIMQYMVGVSKRHSNGRQSALLFLVKFIDRQENINLLSMRMAVRTNTTNAPTKATRYLGHHTMEQLFADEARQLPAPATKLSIVTKKGKEKRPRQEEQQQQVPNDQVVELRTVKGMRIILHKITLKDKAFLKSLFTNRDAMKHYESGNPTPDSEWDELHRATIGPRMYPLQEPRMSKRFADWVERSDQGKLSWWIIKARGGLLLGAIGTRLDHQNTNKSMLDVCILLVPDKWNDGVAKEALWVLAMHYYQLDMLDSNRFQLSKTRVEVAVHPDNISSRTLATQFNLNLDNRPRLVFGRTRVMFSTWWNNIIGGIDGAAKHLKLEGAPVYQKMLQIRKKLAPTYALSSKTAEKEPKRKKSKASSSSSSA